MRGDLDGLTQKLGRVFWGVEVTSMNLTGGRR